MFFNRKKKRGKFPDYHEKKFENPFFGQKKKIVHFGGLKTKLILAALVLLLGSAAWFFSFSSFWQIKEISINGLDRTSNDEIRRLLDEQIAGQRLLFLPQRNLLLFSEKKFLEIIKEKYRFSETQIKKKWPGKLEISIREKTLACVWNEGDKYYYADQEGYVLTEVSPLDLAENKYPLITNESSFKIASGKIQADQELIAYAAALLIKFAEKLPDLSIEKFIVDQSLDTIKVQIPSGPKISFNTKENVDKQMEKLLIIKTEKLKDSFKSKKYIDLRFGDKTYYQ